MESVALRGRLLVVSHKRHEHLGDNRFIVIGGFAHLKTQFALHADEVRLCVPVYPAKFRKGGAVTYPSNLQVAALPPLRSRSDLIRQLPRVVTTLFREIRRADLVYAMCPTDLGLLALCIARLCGAPFFSSIDTNRAAMSRVRYGGIKAAVVAKVVNGILRCFGGDRPAYFTGGLFLGDRPHWKRWVKTTVTSQELPPPIKPCAAKANGLHIVFAGRLTREKNVECLLEAVSLLETWGCSIQATIIGDGTERQRLVIRARTLGLAGVRFVGDVERQELIDKRFFGADVLVLPSLEERQGKVLLEAMACSIPVVASKAGGIPSVVADGTTGLLFDPRSPYALSRSLIRLKDDMVLRQRLVANGYEFARAHTLDRGVADIMAEVTTFYGLPVRTVALT